MGSTNTLRLDFRSGFEILDLVQVVCDHVGRMVGLDEDGIHWVGVAVRESVINAVKHGNANDVNKYVHVEFTALDDGDAAGGPGLAIRVRDEGQGFDPAALRDPLAPENLLRANGRGIFLMRSFMDEMTLQRAPEGGMEVLMVKRAPVNTA